MILQIKINTGALLIKIHEPDYEKLALTLCQVVEPSSTRLQSDPISTGMLKHR